MATPKGLAGKGFVPGLREKFGCEFEPRLLPRRQGRPSDEMIRKELEATRDMPRSQGALRAKIWTDAINKALALKAHNGKTRLENIAETLVKLAEGGDMAAIREVGQRVEGKVSTHITVEPQLTHAQLLAQMARLHEQMLVEQGYDPAEGEADIVLGGGGK